MTIEFVDCCPACGGSSYRAYHTKVPDFVFRASAELWDVVQCDSCQSLYLPRRPDTASIGRYYERYYTHTIAPDSAPISGIAVQSGLLKGLANSWRNARYGTSRPSKGLPGYFFMILAWPLRQWIQAECRHLPLPFARHAGFRVLDVGFGDGRFLQFAAESGCLAVGVEVDAKAVSAARERGIDAHAGDVFDALARFGGDSFDYITLSHVIEHVHEPRKVLACAAQLLRPGGILWVEWPNPQSFGHNLFASRWRDLDPPRHLCIMSRDALVSAASAVGLALDAEHYRPFVSFEVFPFSAKAAGQAGGKSAMRLRCVIYELLGFFRPQRSEWLTLSFKRFGDSVPAK